MIRWGWLAVAGLAALGPSGRSPATSPAVPASPMTAAQPSALPFGVGEKLEYQVKFSFLSVGSATMEVLGLETVRGRSAFHLLFRIRGGALGVRVNDRFESWLDTRTISSLRFVEDIHEAGYKRQRRFEFYPERRELVEGTNDPEPSVEFPLDEGSFIYFLRTIPLEVGQRYVFDRYYRPDRNPVIIQVTRRERIRVADREWDAVVIRPVIRTKGLFSDDGQAEIWLSDDANRIMLQMKSRLSIGSINLFLKSHQLPTDRRPSRP